MFRLNNIISILFSTLLLFKKKISMNIVKLKWNNFLFHNFYLSIPQCELFEKFFYLKKILFFLFCREMPRGKEDTASFFSQRRASYPQNIRIKRYSMLSSLCRNLFDFSQFFSFSFQRSKTCALLSFFDKIN